MPGPAYKRLRGFSRFQDPRRRRIGFCALQPSAFVCNQEAYCGIPTAPISGEVVPSILSPGIRYFGGLLHSTPIRFEIVLGGGEVPVSGKGGRHGRSADSARTAFSAEQDPRFVSPSISRISESRSRRDVSLQLSVMRQCACQGALSAPDLTRRWSIRKVKYLR